MEDAGIEVKTDFIRGAQGIKGDKGEQGEKGDKGDKGDKGEAFKYDDLTPEQIEELRKQIYEGLITQDEMDIILGNLEEKNTEQDNAMSTMQDNIEAEIETKISKSAIKTINASDDFNNLIETGIYQYGGTNSANRPPNWGTVEVTNANGYIVHKCYGSGSIATRFSTDNGSTWMDWQEWRATSQNITTGTEYLTGRIIDGKKEYAKRINIGAMPNATTKNIATGLSNITLTRPIEGVMTAANQVLNLPLVNYGISSNTAVNVYLANTSGDTLGIRTNYDWSAATGVVTIYYTKN